MIVVLEFCHMPVIHLASCWEQVDSLHLPTCILQEEGDWKRY